MFARALVKDFWGIAAIAPSSRFLARAMTAPLGDLAGARVLELGPGTGPMTRALLEAVGPEGRVVAMERNVELADWLRAQFNGVPLTVLAADARDVVEHAEEHLGGPADAVVSSLGLTWMSQSVQDQILDAVHAALRPGGGFTQFQYLHSVAMPGAHFRLTDRLTARFGEVATNTVWRNVPPARVYACRTPSEVR